MKKDLKVALCQFEPVWEDASENLQRLNRLLETLHPDVDLICLPEMFATGFSMRTEAISQTMEGQIVSWMQDAAKRLQMVLCGSVSIRENGQFYNRLLFFFPDGSSEYYDKRHLFSLAKEQNHYASGDKRVVVDLNGWRIMLQICYDLRFPAFVRYDGDYDILLYVASWPDPRIYAWHQLLIARAIENMSYVLGVNRVGDDPNQNQYCGNSMVVDPMGKILNKAEDGEQQWVYSTLSREMLEGCRTRFGFLNDRDSVKVT